MMEAKELSEELAGRIGEHCRTNYSWRNKEDWIAMEIIGFLESHQQAKSKEVAERVFNKFNDDFIEEEGKEGGLRDNELQMFWEGGISIRNKIKAAFGKEGEG